MQCCRVADTELSNLKHRNTLNTCCGSPVSDDFIFLPYVTVLDQREDSDETEFLSNNGPLGEKSD